MSSTENEGKTVTLVYEPHGRFASERVFHGLTDDDVAFVVAALVGRRYSTGQRDADMEQLKDTREAQIDWYATRMVEALFEGLGRWRRLLPERVLRKVVELQVDYVRDLTATWSAELIGLHSEVSRTRRPLIRRPPRQRSAPENGPRIRCAFKPCMSSMLLGEPLPEGWTEDASGAPHCPDHPVTKGEAA